MIHHDGSECSSISRAYFNSHFRARPHRGLVIKSHQDKKYHALTERERRQYPSCLLLLRVLHQSAAKVDEPAGDPLGLKDIDLRIFQKTLLEGETSTVAVSEDIAFFLDPLVRSHWDVPVAGVICDGVFCPASFGRR